MSLDVFRKKFLERLTEDTATNQAIFDGKDGYPCFDIIDLDMVLTKFDLAVEDYLKLERAK